MPARVVVDGEARARLGGRAEASHAFTADGSERAEGARERVRVRVEKRQLFGALEHTRAKRARVAAIGPAVDAGDAIAHVVVSVIVTRRVADIPAARA